MKLLIVGAGLAGAVLSRELAEAGHDITVIDKRPHIAGNCYDEVNENGERIHVWGPHLLHSSEDSVGVKWLSQFTEWTKYRHKVRARLKGGKSLPLPVNADTLEGFFEVSLPTEEEARAFLESKQVPIEKPQNTDEVFLKSVGEELANVFFRPYTSKMWGKDAKEIDAAVGARIPVRFDRNDEYFNDEFQALPSDGYTIMFNRIFSHAKIELTLGAEFEHNMAKDYDYIFTAQSPDSFFNYELGKLPYRSVKFIVDKVWADQEAPVVNFTDDGPYTRRTQYDLLPNSGRSLAPYHTAVYEKPCDAGENNDERFYPVRNAESLALYGQYMEKAKELGNVAFIGRTGGFIYEDMVPSVTRHLMIVKKFLAG
jgi:UDP-galactopyranose mutase